MRTKDQENERRQRQQLLNAAWKLFYEKGYQDTTLDDILKEAKCSKGRFYYYFRAKAELLDSLYELFDQKYEEFYGKISLQKPALEKMMDLNRFMFDFMSEEIGVELLTSLYLSQLGGTTGIAFWNEERAFSKILTKIVKEGQEKGEIRTDVECSELVEDLVAEERSQLISWCLKKGSYSLTEVSLSKIERFYISYMKRAEELQV